MNEDRIYGSAKNLGGKAEEGFGRVTGDVKSQVQGAAKQAEGAMQDLYGQAKDAATSATEANSRQRQRSGGFRPRYDRAAPVHRRCRRLGGRIPDRSLCATRLLLNQGANAAPMAALCPVDLHTCKRLRLPARRIASSRPGTLSGNKRCGHRSIAHE